MKSPKGFGKKYFTFASVLAYSIQRKVQNISIQVDYLLKNDFISEDEKPSENDPPIGLSALLCTVKSKPCHCNYSYKLKTTLSLRLNIYIARCVYYTTYFAFRRSGVHPPHITF